MASAGKGGLLSAPPSRGSSHRSPWIKYVAVLVTVALCIRIFGVSLQYSGLYKDSYQYPNTHPMGTKHIINTDLRFIFPAIEDVQALNEIGIDSLFIRRGTDLVSLNVLDDPNIAKQMAIEETLNTDAKIKAKHKFKNIRKYAHWSSPGKSPRIVIVSALNYNMYSPQALLDLIQNRVKYAMAHNYGVYVRWNQEFVPEMNDLKFFSDRERSKWARLFCLRAAMFAFPHTEWFWYVDEDALIMKKDLDIGSYLLTPDALNAAMLRNQPIVPPTGIIKTSQDTRPENVKFIFTQLKEKIETGSFLVKNDPIAKGMLDIWLDKLFLSYNNFQFGPDSAITHILQWHPYFLGRTIIVPARMISSVHNPSVTEEMRATDSLNYYPGDLVAQWTDCSSFDSCGAILSDYLQNQSSM